MKTFCVRAGMVLFWKGWFWVVDRKLNESWRLRKLAENAYQTLPLSIFFDEMRRERLSIVSERPGNPMVNAPIDALTRLASQFRAHLDRPNSEEVKNHIPDFHDQPLSPPFPTPITQSKPETPRRQGNRRFK